MTKKVEKDLKKKRIIKIAVKNFIESLVGAIIVYLIIGPFNNNITTFLENVSNNTDALSYALNFAIIIFPIIFIVLFMISLLIEIFSNNNSK